ncbi:MAG TPA: hypothetical protein VGB35_11815 [Gammaproteobacteria bacterium]|jgi:hypothetical protein
MDTPVRYQVVFSGRLRQGYSAADVKKNLTERLRLPPETIERLLAAERTVLKQTASEEEARRIVLQLAASGAIAVIEPSGAAAEPEAVKPAKKKPAPAPEKAQAATPANPVKFTPLRQKWLLRPLLYLTATVEVLFGLLYLGLLLAVAGGLILRSLTSSWIGQYIDAPLLALLLQLLVIVLAGLFLLLLLKPLLSLRLHLRQDIVVPAGQEPDLHAFIEDVCERIGAPMPVEIRLYNDADIRSAYHRGVAGFLQNRIVLTLGVPLVAGLNCSQLAALVARTLNRYRRNFAPRATAILLAMHAWLQRAAYEPDIIDRTLQRWHEEGRLGDAMYGALHGLLAPAGRMVAWRLRLSRLLERRVVHRIVAEADKMALLFTGTDGFIRLLDQNALLAYAADHLLPGLEEQWQSRGELPDNLVQMMVLQSRQYPVSMPQKLRAQQEQRKAAIDDILPSDTQRLKRISHKPVFGAYYCLSPAAVLFRNYSKLTRHMTLRFYHHRLQLPISPYRLQRVIAGNSLENTLQQRLDSRFRGLYVDFLPLRLRQCMHAIATPAEAKKQWGVGIARSESEYPRAKHAREQYDDAEAFLVDAATSEEIHLAGLWREWGEEKLTGSELDEVHQQAREAESEHGQAGQILDDYLKAHGMCLGAALAAAVQAEESAQREGSGLVQKVHQMVSLLERIEHLHAQLQELKVQNILLETLLSYRTVSRKQPVDARLEQRAADVDHLVSAIGVAVKSANYPFTDRKATPLIDYVLENALDDETPQGSFERGHDTVERIALVQRRALVQLIEIAEQAEQALGLRG